MKYTEINFDGIVGQTHNYSGLAHGNLASNINVGNFSSPKSAALQGIDKMATLTKLGVKQAVLAPQPRPDIRTLKSLGFNGSDHHIIAQAAKLMPSLFYACCSSSNMWTANAATISPSPDTRDGRLHITPANLSSHLHRAIETPTTTRMLRAIFRDEDYFKIHNPLPSVPLMSDEGAANHTRLGEAHEELSVEMFVYGRQVMGKGNQDQVPQVFSARQTLEASQTIARLHGLKPSYTKFVQQHPDAIDAGVFHNDVIAVGHRNVLLYHEFAFVDDDALKQELEERLQGKIHFVKVSQDELDFNEAVQTYLFNSQLVTTGNNEIVFVLPTECKHHAKTKAVVDNVIAGDNPIQGAHYMEVRESMRNGGGPACLRLRVVINEHEIKAMNQGVLFDDKLEPKLRDWVEKHYRERLSIHELKDPQLYEENLTALDELTQILKLGSIYDFQG